MSCSKCCASFSRVTLIIINAAIALFGLALIALTLWVRFDDNFEKDLRINIQNSTPNPPDMYQVKKYIREAVRTIMLIVLFHIF